MDLKEENGQPNFTGDLVSAVVDDAPRPFDVICDGLTAMGGLAIDDFLNTNSSSSAVFDVNFYLQLPEILSSFEKDKEKSVSDEAKTGGSMTTDGKPSRNAVALLRQTCESVLGSFEALSYDYLESNPKNRQCILTITRPHGGTRAYKSEAGPLRRAEAKARAAQIAIDMGAIDFITSGDSDALKAKQGLLANPLEIDIDHMELEESTQSQIPLPSRPPGPLKEIQDCCDEWRAGRVKPHFVFYTDSKNRKKHGAALRISLIAHVFRAYSVNPVYDSPSAAKHACAKLALQQGVKEFIMHGNGQTEPHKIVDNTHEESMIISRNSPAPFKGITLQDYYETLPQPFPEDVGSASAVEINGPAWLNLALQSARGARLVSNFTPIMDTENKLHGCLLRIERPDETRTYFVDPQFPKRADARSAVCLLAMSQGVGDYIRGLKEEAENKLPEHKRKLANEKLLQILASECAKVRPGNRISFVFVQERDAFGCTLKVDVSSNPDEPDKREYAATTEYRTKADAKAAVACIAAEQGLVDLLRFKGGPLPSDYIPFWEAQVNGDGDTYVPKRKEPEREVDGEGRDRKKRKKGKDNGAADNLEIIPPPLPPMPPRRGPAKSKPQSEEHILPPMPSSLPATPVNSSGNSRWKAPHATSSRGLGPTDVYAPASRSVGQDRSGSRSGGPPRYPRSRGNMSPHYSEAPSYSRYERSPREYPYDDRIDYGHDSSYRDPPPPPPGDIYRGSYSRYPPQSAVQTHYPSSGYVSSPPVPPHHYQTYYGAPPTPPHDPYHRHYVYPSPYMPPQPYPHSPFPVGYPSHPPVIYSPHPPPMAMVPASPPAMPSTEPFPSSYPSSYPPHRSPSPPYAPQPRSPPRHSHHSHHASDYISPESSRYNFMNNHRRHSTIGDSSRSRDDKYRPRPQRDEKGWYEGNDESQRPSPPPPPHPRWPRRDSDYGRPRSRSSTPSRTNSNSERSVSEHGKYTRRIPEVDSQKGSFSEAEVSKIEQTPANEPQSVPEKVKQEPVTDVLSPKPANSPKAGEKAEVENSAMESQQDKKLAQTSDIPRIKEEDKEQQSRTRTNLEILNEFCEKKNIVKPTFYHQVVHEEDGSKTYKVWAEKDSQRMELKSHFKSIEEGHEKLSKSVLQYERSKLARK